MALRGGRPAASHAALQNELAVAQAARAARQQPELDPSLRLLRRALEYLHTRGEAHAVHAAAWRGLHGPACTGTRCRCCLSAAVAAAWLGSAQPAPHPRLQCVPAPRQSFSSALFRTPCSNMLRLSWRPAEVSNAPRGATGLLPWHRQAMYRGMAAACCACSRHSLPMPLTEVAQAGQQVLPPSCRFCAPIGCRHCHSTTAGCAGCVSRGDQEPQHPARAAAACPSSH